MKQPRPPARFRIRVSKRAPWRWYLKDTARPSFLGTYPSHEAALRGMDNIIRRERNMPARIAITHTEILDVMVAS